ncbi:F-box domain, partial [Dillenia turbinata]
MDLSLEFVDDQESAMIMGIGNDLMVEILSRLPLKSLLSSECVCKCWYKLISDPIFISRYSLRNPEHHVAGFYLQRFCFFDWYSKLEFITFDGEKDAAPYPSLSFIEDEAGVVFEHSCNGLLLCRSSRCHDEDWKFYICKPTTKQYHLLPQPDCRKVFGISISYDPKISQHYIVVCVCDSYRSECHRQLQIYNSESGLRIGIQTRVFWNGAIHWVGKGQLALRFDVEREALLRMRMPPIHEDWSERRLKYFGESGDHLYLIEVYEATTFNVMEMERDYSGWFVSHRVDLAAVVAEFPEMMRNSVQLQPIHRLDFSILHIIHKRVEGKEEAVLVLHIAGKLISYTLID